MGFRFSPKIVTDGLVLFLDAANRYSYVSGDTVWNDLSKEGNNGTLVGAPAFDSDNLGSIAFDGTEYILCGYMDEVDNSPAFSISMMVKFNANALYGMCKQYQSATIWVEFNRLSTGEIRGIINGTGGYGTSTETPLSNTDIWYYVSLVYSGDGVGNSNRLKLYVNATEIALDFVGTIGSTSSDFTTEPSFNIADRYTGVNRLKGNIPLFQLYNKALSQNEVTQNYNTLKGRYGL